VVHKIRTLGWLVTLLFFAGAAHAQQIERLDGSTITLQEIDSTVEEAMKGAHVTGVGVAIFHDARIRYLKAYGMRDTEKRLPLTPDSVMTAASLTKAAFATAVMQLVHQRIIDLDRPVYQYLAKPLPDYEKYQDLAGDLRYQQTTMRTLLDHSSGFPNWRWLTADKKLKIFFAPGSRFAYSGEGIALAQMVVESVTHKPINELMSSYLFGPGRMTRTSMVWESRFEDDFANGYDEQGKSLGPERRAIGDAAGSMQTTLRDYAGFVQAVLSGALPENTVRELMFSPQIPIVSKHEFPSLAFEPTAENQAIRRSYGLSWGLYWTPYGRVFFKEGHDEGWRHYVAGFDGPKSGILIMTNSSNGEDIYSTLLETLLRDTFTPLDWEGFKPSH
jgi:CubicO group peptidase (beta-lactamase class C family)